MTSNLRSRVLHNSDFLKARDAYDEAEYNRACAAEVLKNAKNAKSKAHKEYRDQQWKAQEAYDKAVEETLVKVKEHFGHNKFTAADVYSFTNGDISIHEFASWAWHYALGFYPYSHLGCIRYHLPKDTKTTGPRRVVKKFAELDENGQVIPGTEFTKEREECALYWFED